VTSGGKVIRRRLGKYDSQTGALVEQTQVDSQGTGRGKDITTSISWDAWGNLTRLENGGSYVAYTWDSTHHQYPETITRGGPGAGPYSSHIVWDKKWGAKTKETDENDYVISYKYDAYGRLIEVCSPYDTTQPAVSYTYETAEGRWYAVTRNKVSFAPQDGKFIRTVIAVDGLGKALVTAKEGAVWDGYGEQPGWNIAGPASVDEKGRTVAQGQSVFLSGSKPEAEVAAFPFSAGNYSEYNQTYRLRYPTITEYDSQDRPVKVTLPDGSVQRTEYAIRSGQRVVTATDPLGNISVQKTDARGNIAAVLRYNAKGVSEQNLLTSATYNYNAIGEMTEAIDHHKNILSVEYDMMGRRIAMQSPDLGRKDAQ
jgi:YD repeat-containing protein